MARSYLHFDIESCPLDNADEYLDTPEPDARLTDPAKVAADIEKKRAAQLDNAGKDWNVGRIVAIAWARDDESVDARVAPREADERNRLADFWDEARVPGTVLVGFFCRSFDLPFCIQRSRYLGIRHPPITLARYRRDPVCDLYDELTFDNVRYGEKPPMKQSLKSFARRFGIPSTDDIDGSQIAALVAAGRWDDVQRHVTSDVELTRQLFQKLGIGIGAAVAHV